MNSYVEFLQTQPKEDVKKPKKSQSADNRPKKTSSSSIALEARKGQRKVYFH